MFMNIKMTKWIKNWHRFVLGLILCTALFLRVYQLTSVPPSLSWDEVAVGYNGYTIANYARDEYGKFMPLTFRSFGDDKSPIHVYVTAMIVKIFGLSDFSIRFGPAVFGVLSVWMIYLLLNEMYKSKLLGLIGALLLSISPFNLQFSRFNHEASFALFFYFTGLWLWFKGVRDGFWLPFSIIAFGLCMLSYHSSKVVVPLTLGLLGIFYVKNIIRYKFYAIVCVLLVIGFGMLYFFNPDLLGLARAKQTTISVSEIEKLQIYSDVKGGKTWFSMNDAERVARTWLAGQRYLVFFQPEFLYLKGDSNLRFSTQSVGQFYRIDLVFLLIGVISLIFSRKKQSYLLLLLTVIAPIPAAITGGLSEIGHSGRGLFIMLWIMVAAFGMYSFFRYLGSRGLIAGLGIIIVMWYGYLFSQYLFVYHVSYAENSAIEWQYGMKEIVSYVEAHPEYSTVYVTDIRSQPYIFFLNYLKYPLYDYLREVEFNPTEKRSHNNVYSFGKYHFGDWDQIQSMPIPGVLYVVEPSIYSGLAHKADFEVKKLVKYPNGSDAFYLVSAK
jgi:4-amino-4-deoxy-L-arabinose transferase-like glycosyltransferase